MTVAGNWPPALDAAVDPVAGPRGEPKLNVVVLNWRDTSHPEGGGSERYVETVAAGLAAAGHEVTLVCAAYPGAPRREQRDGYTIVRHGGTLTVYGWALLRLLTARDADVVIDVQNGMPFFSRLVARCPVIVLVHHVHREQWPVVFGRAVAAFGWWLESWLAPRLYRRCRYVTVSHVTRRELTALGVDAERISVVHNGVPPAPQVTTVRAAHPRLVVVGRLVPHKQVEHALQVAAALRADWPTLRVSVVGDGYWRDRLEAEAQRRGVADITEFHGYLDERAKHEELARSWLILVPSLKEGWGLVVTEAAGHQVPAIGYATAGGLAEAIVHGETGVLTHSLTDMVDAVDALLRDRARRERLGQAAAARAAGFGWDETVRAWRMLVTAVGSKSSRTVRGADLR